MSDVTSPQPSPPRLAMHHAKPAHVSATHQKQTASHKIRFVSYMRLHAKACRASLKYLIKSPFTTIITLAIIAVTLALPAGCFIVTKNFQIVTATWRENNPISLYLKPDMNVQSVEMVLKKISSRMDVGKINYISPAEGLTSLQQHLAMGDVLNQLPNNPLPGVIEIVPAVSVQSAADLQSFILTLKQLPEVDRTQLNIEGLKHFYAAIAWGQQVLSGISLLLVMSAILIIGNVLRTAIKNMRDEIEANRSGRLPLLYMGILYSLFAGMVASIIVVIMMTWLSMPKELLT